MGVYDSVIVPCPQCGTRQEAQSKSGDCVLAMYDIEDCPPDVLANVNRHAPFACEGCGTVFEVELTLVARSIPVHREESMVSVSVTHDMGTWCDTCTEYISAERPAAIFPGQGTLVRICLECLREAAAQCEEAKGERVVRGARE